MQIFPNLMYFQFYDFAMHKVIFLVSVHVCVCVCKAIANLKIIFS